MPIVPAFWIVAIYAPLTIQPIVVPALPSALPHLPHVIYLTFILFHDLVTLFTPADGLGYYPSIAIYITLFPFMVTLPDILFLIPPPPSAPTYVAPCLFADITCLLPLWPFLPFAVTATLPYTPPRLPLYLLPAPHTPFS